LDLERGEVGRRGRLPPFTVPTTMSGGSAAQRTAAVADDDDRTLEAGEAERPWASWTD
jgi:hypothetical protein